MLIKKKLGVSDNAKVKYAAAKDPYNPKRTVKTYDLPTEKTVPVNDLQQYAIGWYGEPGVGKSALGAQFPDVVFAAFEARHKHLSLFKVPTDKPTFSNWDEWMGYCRAISESEKFRNVVLDTADAMYRLCAIHVCEERGWDHQSDAPPGKAYDLVDIELFNMLRLLQSAGKGVIFISHSSYRDVERANGSKFTRLETSLTGKASKFIVNAVDLLGYFGYKGEERRLWIRGNDFIMAKCTFENHFKTKDGQDVNCIPMGSSPEEGYKNLLKAFNNQQVSPGEENAREVLPSKRAGIDFKKR